jgi:Zn-dependent oligopeptidase
MENFVLEDSLNKWKHYDTGAVLPKDLQDKLKAQRTFMAGRYLTLLLISITILLVLVIFKEV